MHIGLTMECDYREGRSQDEAFNEAFSMADAAEELGYDGVWLAERHFAPPGGPGGIPSVVSAPLIIATAIAARTKRLRVGTAVLVLPLGHPVRLAEEVATLDNVSGGRLDLGIGRSGFARAYEGYNIPYSESRDRFGEYLEVMRLAWTQERFSYDGKYYSFQDVHLVPKPLQKPHPPLRAAATTKDTFPMMGNLGMPIFMGLRGMVVSELAQCLKEYRSAWAQAGHPGDGDVMLRLPAYVGKDMDRALREPEASTMVSYARLRQAYLNSAGQSGTTTSEERAQRAERLEGITYEDLLQDRLAYGTPEVVAERLGQWRDELGLSGVIIEPNVGGRIPAEQVAESVRLFADEVIPALR
jgi:alkanesulfonate monooxygenase SsuD/methylene tetrahydromethanopterin reductase-like flavin-dependent oxidoreductase (luciferase family)